jgi:membrane protease YdiL (CAAX protease family)
MDILLSCIWRKGETMNTKGQSMWKEWLALFFALPIYVFPVIRYLSTGGAFSLRDMFIYTGAICGAEIVAILLLQRFWIKEKIAAFNLKPATFWKDLLAGILLGVITLVLSFVTRNILAQWLENETVGSMKGLFAGLQSNPALLIWWLGPLVLIGVSQEELTRAFTLNRLWKIWPNKTGRWVAVLVSALIFAFAHVFEGATGVIWAAIYGGIMAIYYLRYGRLTPMIVAHYINNVFNFIAILTLIEQGIITL